MAIRCPLSALSGRIADFYIYLTDVNEPQNAVECYKHERLQCQADDRDQM